MLSFHVTVGLESPAWSVEECREHALGLADDYFPRRLYGNRGAGTLAIARTRSDQ